MMEILRLLNPWILPIVFFVLIIASVYFLRVFLKKNFTKSRPGEIRFLVQNIALALSLGIILAAFEFPVMDNLAKVSIVNTEHSKETVFEPIIPITKHKIPSQSKPQLTLTPKIEPVSDETILVDDLTEVVEKAEDNVEDIIDEIVKGDLLNSNDEEVIEKIVDFAQESAEPKLDFSLWMRKNLKYPRQAKRMGIEGKVIVQFIIEKDGKLTDIKVLRGIGGGCDEEAVRILTMADPWKPGRQNGVPIRQRMIVPIYFRMK